MHKYIHISIYMQIFKSYDEFRVTANATSCKGHLHSIAHECR